jgi:TPP-dependent pyruvate/acetoin dehydrogenase alpha subunit
MALAEQQKRSGAVVVVFLGDGTLGEGVVYEAFNIASLWKLPILFAIENNGYAQSTPSTLQIAGEIAARPVAFGIPTSECSGADVRQVLSTTAAAIDAVRGGGGPRCVIAHTYRLAPHSKGDDTRAADELAAAWARDPLKAARAGVGDEARAAAIDRTIEALVTAARRRAIDA